MRANALLRRLPIGCARRTAWSQAETRRRVHLMPKNAPAGEVAAAMIAVKDGPHGGYPSLTVRPSLPA